MRVCVRAFVRVQCLDARASENCVRFAPWAIRTSAGDPQDDTARAEHLAFLENLLATREFRGATGRLQQLAIAKRMSRLSTIGAASCTRPLATFDPTTMMRRTMATGGEDLAIEAWGKPTVAPEPEPEPQPQLEPEPKTQLASELESQPEPEPEVPSWLEPEPEPTCQLKPVPEPETEPEPSTHGATYSFELGHPGSPPPVPTVGAGIAASKPSPVQAVDAGAQRAKLMATRGKQYVCKRRAVIRGGFEINSAKVGTLERDAVIDVLEERSNQQGTLRVRFSQGWVSKTTAAGLVVLKDEEEQTTSPNASMAISKPAVDEGGHSARYCKKCKVIFSASICPASHANFMYTKVLPT